MQKHNLRLGHGRAEQLCLFHARKAEPSPRSRAGEGIVSITLSNVARVGTFWVAAATAASPRADGAGRSSHENAFSRPQPAPLHERRTPPELWVT